MKRFTTSLIALSMSATPLLAESHTAAEDTAADEMQAEQMATDSGNMGTDNMDNAQLIRSRDITGGNIYSMGTTYDENMWSDTQMFDAVEGDWTDIGEIEDVVFSPDGQITGIVAEVGGFLDVGDKHVMIELQDIRLIPVDDQTYAVVTRRTEEELEQMEGVDEGFWD